MSPPHVKATLLTTFKEFVAMLVVTSIVVLVAVVLALVVGSEEVQLQRQAGQVSKKTY